MVKRDVDTVDRSPTWWCSGQMPPSVTLMLSSLAELGSVRMSLSSVVGPQRLLEFMQYVKPSVSHESTHLGRISSHRTSLCRATEEREGRHTVMTSGVVKNCMNWNRFSVHRT